MNPAVSTFGWIHNVPDGWRRTLARQADGAKIVLVDPNHTESTAKSDRHVQVWPGQDWALLLGVIVTIVGEGLARTPPQPVLTGMAELEQLVREVDIADLATRWQGIRRHHRLHSPGVRLRSNRNVRGAHRRQPRR